ncbi:response regulator transcription factor [Dokdonella koreensis]|uniref:Two component LuxR family transcriptional regulator n=1 Tax=Dokdonella koreensis DS-123 TaxID=1300342 RepID=A0A167G1F3_9GAMM|nr:response regulator transcription factor [Dokdonella koreensis]ANB16052.1 Two component LuxR family transcriptional regulator [Dokdonella koreensis DS-123]
MLKVLIADDHPLFRLALRQAVAGIDTGVRITEADDLDAARAQLAEHPDTDLALLDLHMPGNHGLMGLASLRAEFPAVAVAMVSAHDEPDTIRRALAYGAAGFIAKRAGLEDLQTALRAILACQTWIPPERRADVAATGTDAGDGTLATRLNTLSPQQFRVLALVAQGRLNKQIAAALAIQERTVKAHVTAIFEKLGVRNRTQAGVLLSTLQLTAREHDDPAAGA